MSTILRTFLLLLLGLWLGAAVFFGAAVAPNLFGVLRGAQLANADELAGNVVSRLLAIINVAGFFMALFGIVAVYFSRMLNSRGARFIGMISLAIMAIMTGVSRWIISTRMSVLRAAMNTPVDQIAIDDPRRVAFDSLHQNSVRVMGVALVAGLIAFVVVATSRTRLRS
jgi:hypothetical protein